MFARFLDLPPELRSAVYELVFAQEYEDADANHGPKLIDPLAKKGSERPGRCKWHDARKTLAVTWTCAQVRKEALPIFYASNAFVFDIHRLYGQDRKTRLPQSQLTSHLLTIKSWSNKVVAKNLPSIKTLVLVLANDSCKFGKKRRHRLISIKINFSAAGVRVDHDCTNLDSCCTRCAEKGVAVKEVEAVCNRSWRDASENATPRLSGRLLDALLTLCSRTNW